MRALFRHFLSRLSRMGKHRPGMRLPVLAISPCYMEQLAIRIISSNRHWNLVVCPNFEIAMYARQRGRFAVILYDLDVTDIDWRKGIHELLTGGEPVCVIAVSSRVDDVLWQAVLECGAYDLQRKPLKDNYRLAHAVEEAHAFVTSRALSDLWDKSPIAK